MLETRHAAQVGAAQPRTTIVLIVALALSVGCGDLIEPDTPGTPQRPESRSTGETVLTRMSQDVPTFAGFFLENETPVLLVTDMSSKEHVRAAFASVKGAVIPVDFALTDDVEVRLAKYSFDQLAQWRDAVYEVAFKMPDVVSLDLNEKNNRIEIGLATGAGVGQVRASLNQLDLPPDAIATEVTGLFEVTRPSPTGSVRPSSTFAQTLDDKVRPVVGGVEVWRTAYGADGCTAGFNFKIGSNPTDYVMTASHCTPDMWGLDGENWYQPGSGGSKLIGAEGADPNWFLCGTRVCRYSDAAGIDYSISDHLFGYIARTTSRSTTSAPITINSSSPRMRINFEYHGSMMGLTVDKIGHITGWTYGTVTNTCITIKDHFVSGHEWRCHNKATYGGEEGDSGSPVFVWQGSTVQIAGVHVGRHGGKSVYSTMDGIETDFGPIYTYYSVFINGPGGVWSPGTYTWEALPSPPSGSHSYQWKVQYLSTGNWVTLGTGKTQQLYMDGATGHVLLKVTSTFAQTGISATHERVISNNIGGGPEQPSRRTP